MYKLKNSMTIRLIVLVSVVFLGFDNPKLVKTKITKDITVSIPQGWRPMDDMDFTQRYPSVRAPLAAFTDNDRLVDFSVNISATQWPDADLEIASKFFKASLMNMFDKVEIKNEGIRDIKGKKFIYFEFESRVNGNKNNEGLTDPVLKYSYLQYLVERDRTIVFSFNSPKRLREQWQETASAMMKSIRVKS
jgi:hypothetical protein